MLAVTDKVAVLCTSPLSDQVPEPFLNLSFRCYILQQEINGVYFKNHSVNVPLQLHQLLKAVQVPAHRAKCSVLRVGHTLGPGLSSPVLQYWGVLAAPCCVPYFAGALVAH